MTRPRSPQSWSRRSGAAWPPRHSTRRTAGYWLQDTERLYASYLPVSKFRETATAESPPAAGHKAVIGPRNSTDGLTATAWRRPISYAVFRLKKKTSEA